jgi:DNA-directed RNA polymerase subunit N (RpoN/RPB10)
MYTYIVCLCGRSLGDIYDLYHAFRTKKLQDVLGDTSGADPALMLLMDDIQIDMQDVFAMLHIHLECCRARLTSQVTMAEYLM